MLLVLSCVLLLVGFQQGQANENCPSVEALGLYCPQNSVTNCNPGYTSRQAFINFNGNMCLGCKVCVLNFGPEQCPPYFNYGMEVPPGCEPENYSQKVLIGRRMCRVVDTYRCRTSGGHSFT